MTNPSDPAFLTIETYPSGSKAISSGLTKREEFARSAMLALLANSYGSERWGIKPEDISREAILQADALIAALNRTEDKKHGE